VPEQPAGVLHPGNGQYAAVPQHNQPVRTAMFTRLRCRLARCPGISLRLLRRCLPGMLLLLAWPAASHACAPQGIVLQVLGSGGPVADSDRAASGFLIWVDGKARVLVDAGGGVFLRFGQSGARIEDLDLLALTHLHTDHAADVPALLMGGYFSPRDAVLPVSGPGGNARMPSIGGFLDAMFAGDTGAFRYLSGFLDGSDGLFALRPVEVDASSRSPVAVFENARLKATATGVNHGPIPTLGYLFEIDGTRIAISGDQNLDDAAFVRLATDADLMVMPLAIPEDAGKVARSLHATPSRIGAAAHSARPGRLVLSHLMQRSLRDLDGNLAVIQHRFPGEVTVANDLTCIEAGRRSRSPGSTHTP
jgi:ribonuclease BN (tRNA processing enzyme)